jgi:hypothetical protein
LAQFPSIFRNVCNSLSIVLIVPVRVQPRTAPKRSFSPFLRLDRIAHICCLFCRSKTDAVLRLSAIASCGQGESYGGKEVWWELLTEEPTSDLSNSYKVEAAPIFFSNSVFDAADNVINGALA